MNAPSKIETAALDAAARRAAKIGTVSQPISIGGTPLLAVRAGCSVREAIEDALCMLDSLHATIQTLVGVEAEVGSRELAGFGYTLGSCVAIINAVNEGLTHGAPVEDL